MNKRLENIGITLHNGEIFEIGENKELIITEFDNDFLALANGFKACGGDVYILQTLGLHTIQFDLSERRNDYEFMIWCTQAVKN